MRHLLVSSLAALSLCCVPAHADNVADINKLVRAGQLPAALAKVDVALAQQPKDAQLRFIKGMILSEQGKATEAIAVFQKLTEDFPELPEPYNNLAVLYAGLGQYDKARVALERAIRTSPAYATAHENLGDVYAKLASQSYDKAMQLLDSNQHTPPKSRLSMVRTLKSPVSQAASAPAAVTAATAPAATIPPTAGPAAPAIIAAATPAAAGMPPPRAASTAAAPAAAPAASRPAVPTNVALAPVAPPGAARPAIVPTPSAPTVPPAAARPAAPPATMPTTLAVAPSTARPATPATKVAPELVHVKPGQPASPNAAAAAAAKGADQEAINAALSQWARAWSAQDMKNYLNAYASNFQTPRGQTRQAWAADRSTRIEGKEHIKVTVESPQITVTGNTATVKFRQIYVSDRLKANSRKTLVLEKQGSKWLIKQEQSGS